MTSIKLRHQDTNLGRHQTHEYGSPRKQGVGQRAVGRRTQAVHQHPSTLTYLDRPAATQTCRHTLHHPPFSYHAQPEQHPTPPKP